MEVKTFGVVGAGQMGNGIAQVAAMSGLQVIMSDIKDEFVQRGLDNITKILSRNVEKGKMSAAEKDAVLASEAGASVANGLSMLLHQGVKAFELWTGQTAPVAVIRRALRAVA